MGYYTYITGDMTITPPIDETKFAEFIGGEYDYFKATLIEGDEDVQLVDGQITVVGKSAGHTLIELTFDESVKAYDFEEQVRNLVHLAKTLGHVADGGFYGDGEESEDFWKIDITNNEVTSEPGIIVYPSDRYSDIAQRGKGPGAHGNVIPRPDGKRVRCGGAPLCPECQQEREFLTKLLYGGA